MKDYSILDILTPESNDRLIRIRWQEHPQILFVLNGSIRVICEGKTSLLKTNDVMVINSFSLYQLFVENGLCLRFFLKDQITNRISSPDKQLFFNCNSSCGNNKGLYQPVITVLAELARILLSDASNPYLKLLFDSKVCRLFYELYTNFSEKRSVKNEGQSRALVHFREILEDIRKNYDKAISLKGLAARHYMTPSYISHLFRQFMDKSYTQYIVLLRLEHARELLRTSDLTLEEIADRSGFANARSLSGYFKDTYGILPSVFRKNNLNSYEGFHEKGSLISNYSPVKLAKSLLSPYNGDSTQVIAQYRRPPIRIKLPSISFNAAENVAGFHRHHIFYVPCYYYLLYQNIQDMAWQLTFFGNQTGILLDQIIGEHSSCVFSMKNNKLIQVHFPLLDQVLSFIFKNSLIPVLNLKLYPTDLETFFRILHLLSDHLKASNLKELNRLGICLELSHIPVEEFFTIYPQIFNLIREKLPGLKLYINIPAQDFLQYCNVFFQMAAPDGLILRFLHFHMDDLEIDKIFQYIDESAWAQSQVILSDLCFSPDRNQATDQNPSNDSFIRTTYLCGKWMEYGDRAAGLACLLLTDFNENIDKSHPMFWGENGLTMSVSCRKSVFYLFDCLGHFHSLLLGRGKTFVIQKDNECMEIFLFNPSFNDTCDQENTDYGTIVYTTDLLNQYPKAVFEICLTDLPYKKYIAHFFQVSWKGSCTYQYWLENNQLGIYSDPELMAFKQKSMPSFERRLLLCDNGILDFSLTLEACAITRILLEPVYESF
ncbi:MAG TPA: AraC family transcriptional regulator [Candidatus Scybalocola faecigallinarum]|uniref:AraC family transcriptional regulator n=1 Tax=Candidatus Scybalocola faecigallinarum TaxID=2840941 RepID=A0A9D1F7N2_9FIRM|nr:AraC family transcriptional regulator [Candidatus Scybalocola faecigallinarum]